jgi:hypothetical protein
VVGLQQNERDYVHLLDNVARFFNSEVLAHVGYYLTVTGLVIVLLANPTFGLMREWFRPLVAVFLGQQWFSELVTVVLSILSCGLIFALYFFNSFAWPLSFKYLFARTKFYECLSEVVWDHMGLYRANVWSLVKSRHSRPVVEFKDRALQDGNGIHGAVIRLLEARIAASIRYRRNERGTQEEKRLKEDELSLFNAQKLYEWYPSELDDFYHCRHTFLWWKMLDLLLLAYAKRIKKYREGNQEEQQIGRLLDC